MAPAASPTPARDAARRRPWPPGARAGQVGGALGSGRPGPAALAPPLRAHLGTECSGPGH